MVSSCRAVLPKGGGGEARLKLHPNGALLPSCRGIKAPPIPCNSAIVDQGIFHLPGVRHADTSPVLTRSVGVVPLLLTARVVRVSTKKPLAAQADYFRNTRLNVCLGPRTRGSGQCPCNSTHRASEEFPTSRHSEKCGSLTHAVKQMLFRESNGE